MLLNYHYRYWYNFLRPSNLRKENKSIAENVFEIIYLGTPCDTANPLDTPAFRREWFGCLGKIRLDAKGARSPLKRFGFNVHGFPVEVVNSLEDAHTIEDRLPTLEAPKAVYFSDYPDNLLARDGLRLLMTDKDNEFYASQIKLAITLPRVTEVDASRTCRLVLNSEAGLYSSDKSLWN